MNIMSLNMVRKFTMIFTLLKLVLIPSLTALELSHALFVGCMYKTFKLACSVQGKPLSHAECVAPQVQKYYDAYDA